MNNYDADLLNTLMLHDNARTERDDELIDDIVQLHGFDYVENKANDGKIIAFAAHTLSKMYPEENRWLKIHERYLNRNKVLIEVMESIFLDVQKAGIETLCVTENFGVVLRGKACLGCFQSGDIDFTADRSEQKLIEDVFNKHGFALKKDLKQVTKFKNNDIVEGGFSLQITWVAVARSYLNQDAPTKRLVEARKKASLTYDTRIKVLDSTELLYFCAYHISAGHYYTFTPGIRLYVDIDRLIRGTDDIDWKKIIEWSREDSIGVRAIMPIYLSHKFLRTPIPNEINTYIDESKYASRFARRLLDPENLGFGCDAGRMNRLYIDLASSGTSLRKALFQKVKGK